MRPVASVNVPTGGNAADFTAFVAKQVADWAPAIKAADLK